MEDQIKLLVYNRITKLFFYVYLFNLTKKLCATMCLQTMINYVSNCFEGEPKWIPTQNVIEPLYLMVSTRGYLNNSTYICLINV